MTACVVGLAEVVASGAPTHARSTRPSVSASDQRLVPVDAPMPAGPSDPVVRVKGTVVVTTTVTDIGVQLTSARVECHNRSQESEPEWPELLSQSGLAFARWRSIPSRSENLCMSFLAGRPQANDKPMLDMSAIVNAAVSVDYVHSRHEPPLQQLPRIPPQRARVAAIYAASPEANRAEANSRIHKGYREPENGFTVLYSAHQDVGTLFPLLIQSVEQLLTHTWLLTRAVASIQRQLSSVSALIELPPHSETWLAELTAIAVQRVLFVDGIQLNWRFDEAPSSYDVAALIAAADQELQLRRAWEGALSRFRAIGGLVETLSTGARVADTISARVKSLDVNQL
jgi:hypothetical protein